MSSYSNKHWQNGKAVTAIGGTNAPQKKTEAETVAATKLAESTGTANGGISPQQPQATPSTALAASSKETPSRMTPGERTRIMLEQMRKLGIARANAAYHVAEFAQSMADGSTLGGNPLRVLNVFLNEGIDAKKETDAQTVMAHRTARCKSLINDIAAMVSKKNFVPLVQALMLAAIDPTEVGKAMKETAATH